MDKNTITGLVLIFTILIGFSYFTRPSEEEIAALRQRQDSIQLVELNKNIEQEAQKVDNAIEENKELPDSILFKNATDKLGAFASGAIGKEEFYILENNLIKVTLSNKGGKLYSVELKEYKTYDGKPLILFDGDNNKFGMSFFAQNRSIKTDELFFKSSSSDKHVIVGGSKVKKGKEGNIEYNTENPGESKTIVMTLDAQNEGNLEYIYTLEHNSYILGFNISTSKLGSIIANNVETLNFNWAYDINRLERKSDLGEDRYTSIYYRFKDDEVESLSTAKSSSEELSTKVEWISFKQLFFNATIISEEAFLSANVDYNYNKESNVTLGRFSAEMSVPYSAQTNTDYKMKLYFGPNHYNTLKQYNNEMDQLINLGWSILRWVNKGVILVFNILRNHIDNFGIIILILTILIKIVLFPFTYKSYVSQAKMRALKPEVDEINEKYGSGADKAMEKQKATMNLYKKVGVNPMGGCLPMLLQMPILFAMFYFFPTSIELRGESFLWANDLSSYDSIQDLPFKIPFYGSHISLFCLLMTITTVISTRLNSQTQSSAAMPGMQTMMYIMPVMFMFILNSYPAGLSYYYFLSNLITIGQMYLVRNLIDEDKIRETLLKNKKRVVKKSKFQQRLEEMAKKQQIG